MKENVSLPLSPPYSFFSSAQLETGVLVLCHAFLVLISLTHAGTNNHFKSLCLINYASLKLFQSPVMLSAPVTVKSITLQ